MSLLRINTAIISLLILSAFAHAADPTTSYDQLIADARRLMKEEKLIEAEIKTREAAALDSKRYDAHAVAVLIALRKNDLKAARQELEKALELAPPEKRASLEAMQKQWGGLQRAPAIPSGAAGPLSTLSGEARHKYDALMLIVEDADKARAPDERTRLLREFMVKSAEFLEQAPRQTNIWIIRAAAAIELDNRATGWQVGRRLKELGLESSEEPAIRKILAALERKGWFTDMPPGRRIDGKDWENSLGMKFKPVGNVFFSVWETRVRDFEAFVEATGYDACGGMLSPGKDSSDLEARGDSWKTPGFEQTPNHPVSGVSWVDAVKFCEWLTRIERNAGLISSNETYRLPNDDEWSRAAGSERYPWGNDRVASKPGFLGPPPVGAGNYSGHDYPKERAFISIGGYSDGAAWTAPVATFRPNVHGLFDMGGNVAEWCGDTYRKEMNSVEVLKTCRELENVRPGFKVIRGGSWRSADLCHDLDSGFHDAKDQNYRDSTIGFRCILAPRAELGLGRP